MTEWLKDTLLQVHAPLAYLLVFAFAFLEGPLLLGFVVPGELATILGGALVRFGNADYLPMAIAASVGAAGGDSVGYWMGKWLERKHFGKARKYLREKGARAVIVGRFTAAFRVVIPGVCGISHMPYGRFVAANVVAGVLWGTAFVALGYVAGAAWDRASQLAGWGSMALLLIIVGGWILAKVIRRRRAKRREGGRDGG